MLHEHDPHWSVEDVAAVVGLADLAIALTEHERGRLVESYRARTVAVIPPGVEAHVDCAGGDDGPIALFVGRPIAAKRLGVLDAAMSIVHDTLPDAELIVAGPGAGDLPPGSHTAVDTPTAGDRARLVESARLVVNPSMVESFGLTTLEAWAHRTPVVVADTPVHRSIVHAGVDGVIAGTDAEGLAAGMMSLLADPSEAARLGDAGHRRAREEFSWERSAVRLLDVLG
jgi:glycosyltransferase involved in cell wall biosynthesis